MLKAVAADKNTTVLAPMAPSTLLPKIHPLVRRFLGNEALVYSLMHGYGSPLNVMFPSIITENIVAFEEVYNKRHLQGIIFYTSKPNRSMAVRKEAATNNVGIDVSSAGELEKALSSGFHPERIEATGPKNLDYIYLCLQHNIIINVNSLEELQKIILCHKELSKTSKTKIFIRLDGFTSDFVTFNEKDTAFGISSSLSQEIFDFLLEYAEILDFRGFSFHFVVGDYARRIPAIETCISLTLEAIEKGLSPKGINIGGGYRIQYARSKEEWEEFETQHKKSVLGEIPSFTWNEDGFGYKNESGVIKGMPNYKPHFNEYHGAEDFAQIIDTPLPKFDMQTTAEVLSELMLELYIEPGRALLDQCGITIAQVTECKKSIKGESLVMLDMNRNHINAAQMKLLTDPVFIHKNQNRSNDTVKDGCFLVGNMCLANDMIQYKKIYPLQSPEEGDLVAFINTAAYMMDFAQTNVLEHPVAPKVAITQKTDSKFTWTSDEKYNPLRGQ